MITIVCFRDLWVNKVSMIIIFLKKQSDLKNKNET